MAAHEGLAAGLFGGFGALFAAWLAYRTVQQQIAEEGSAREREKLTERALAQQQQLEAKRVAVTVLARLVASAGGAFMLVERVLKKGDASTQAQLEARLHEGGAMLLIEDALKASWIRDLPRELAVEDRVQFIQIVEALATIVSICHASEPSPRVRTGQLLNSLHKGLSDLSSFLPAFDPELADAFAKYQNIGLSEK